MSATLSGSGPVSAYVPCYNNAGTIGLTIEGIRNQTCQVDELMVIDDGSTDDSVAIVEGLGVRVIRLEKNQGRGAARAAAMEAARNELVLCCDATNRLAANFVATAVAWFSSADVLGVYGRWVDPHARTAIDRWRARHLFQQEIPYQVKHQSNLSTHGTMVRKSAVLRVANYNRLLRHGEDYDLGLRLLAVGDIVFDPELQVEPVTHNTLFQVMERFARWNRASVQHYTLNHLIESHVLAWKILIPRDLAKRDWQAAAISAVLPYFSFAYADKKSLTFSWPTKVTKAAPIEAKN